MLPTRLRRLTLATTLLLMAALPVRAQSLLIDEVTPTTATPSALPAELINAQYQDWRILCAPSPEATCRMLPATPPGGAFLEVSGQLVPRDAGDPALLFIIRTPLGLLLPRGVDLQVDSGPMRRAAYRSCHVDADGASCIVPFEVTAPLAASFRSGLELTLTAYDLDDQPLATRLSLHGFSAASDDLSARLHSP